MDLGIASETGVARREDVGARHNHDWRPEIYCAKIVFIGQFDVIAFLDFASERAERLELGMVIESFSSERFEVVVTGQSGLIDAFEMACSLGPIDCLVLEVLR